MRSRTAVQVEHLTVSALIDALAALDPEALVVVQGTYGGLAPVIEIRRVAIRLAVNSDPDFGPHETAGQAEPADAKAVVLLGGSSKRNGA